MNEEENNTTEPDIPVVDEPVYSANVEVKEDICEVEEPGGET
ncbi:unnamed protein product, partial [Allacma fusca]